MVPDRKITVTLKPMQRFIAYMHIVPYEWKGEQRKILVPLNEIDERFELLEMVTFFLWGEGERRVGFTQYLTGWANVLGYDIFNDPPAKLWLKKKKLFDKLPSSYSYREYFKHYTVDTVNLVEKIYIYDSPDPEDINIPRMFRQIGKKGEKLRFEYGFHRDE